MKSNQNDYQSITIESLNNKIVWIVIVNISKINSVPLWVGLVVGHSFGRVLCTYVYVNLNCSKVRWYPASAL